MPTPPSTVRFQVRKGMSAREIARDLHDNGLIHHRWSFLLWAKLSGIRPSIPGYMNFPRVKPDFRYIACCSKGRRAYADVPRRMDVQANGGAYWRRTACAGAGFWRS